MELVSRKFSHISNDDNLWLLAIGRGVGCLFVLLLRLQFSVGDLFFIRRYQELEDFYGGEKNEYYPRENFGNFKDRLCTSFFKEWLFHGDSLLKSLRPHVLLYKRS